MFRCEADIRRQIENVHNKLKEDEKAILEQLDSLIEEELQEVSYEMPREIQFHPIIADPLLKQNLLGFVAQGGVLPSHLSLSLLSELGDYRAGAILSLEVVGPETKSWHRRIVATALVEGEGGTERKLPIQCETEDGRVLLRFEACLGELSVSVKLYGQHIQSSPALLNIRAQPDNGEEEEEEKEVSSGETVLVNTRQKAEEPEPPQEEIFLSKAAGLIRAPQCFLCLRDARKAKELICDGTIVCWNCAVQVIC